MFTDCNLPLVKSCLLILKNTNIKYAQCTLCKQKTLTFSMEKLPQTPNHSGRPPRFYMLFTPLLRTYSIEQWNSSPNDLQSITDTSTFKYQYKTHVFVATICSLVLLLRQYRAAALGCDRKAKIKKLYKH